eukprot:scaffold174344_cov32-Tisochrysis_lutea.AAC.8
MVEQRRPQRRVEQAQRLRSTHCQIDSWPCRTICERTRHQLELGRQTDLIRMPVGVHYDEVGAGNRRLS